MSQMIDSAVVDCGSCVESDENIKKRVLLNALSENQRWNQENNYAVKSHH